MNRKLLALGLLAISLDLTAAGIYRCTSPGGGVTYQETACAGPDAGGLAKNIPTSFPEVNTAERDRVLRAVALLDQRELQRAEIDSRERIAYAELAQRQREAEMAMNQSSNGDYGYPIGYALAGRGAHLVPIMDRRTRVQHHVATGVGRPLR